MAYHPAAERERFEADEQGERRDRESVRPKRLTILKKEDQKLKITVGKRQRQVKNGELRGKSKLKQIITHSNEHLNTPNVQRGAQLEGPEKVC